MATPFIRTLTPTHTHTQHNPYTTPPHTPAHSHAFALTAPAQLSRATPSRISVADVVRVRDLLEDLDGVVFDARSQTSIANTPNESVVREYPLWMKSDMKAIFQKLNTLQGS